MKPGTLFVILLLLADPFAGPAVGQMTGKRDSLRAAIRNKNQTDTARLRTACNFIMTFDYVEPESLVYYARMYHDASVKADYAYGITSTKVYEGWYYYETGRPKEALKCFLEAIKPAEESGDKAAIGFVYGEVGAGYAGLGMYDKCCEFQLRAIKIFQETGQHAEELKRWSMLANAYAESGNLSKAVDILESLIKRFDSLRIPDLSFKSGALDALGTIYLKKGEHEKAVKAYTEALRLHRKAGNLFFCGITLFNLGQFFLLDSLSLYGRVVGDKRKSPDIALSYLDELRNLSLDFHDTASLADCYALMANAWLQKGNSREALAKILEAGKLIGNNGTLEAKLNYTQVLADIYSSTGAYKAALNQYKLLLGLRDSLEKVKVAEKVSLLTESFEIEQIEGKLSHKEQQLATSRFITWLFVAISILILALAIVALFFFRQKQKAAKILARQNREIAEERNRAEQSEKFKEQFLASMSHEIRTPLNAVIGMTGLLLDEPHPPKTKTYLKNIKQAGEHLTGIINDILDLSKMEAGKLELHEASFSMAELLDELKSIFGVRAKEKGLELSVHFSGEVPPWLWGDAGRLRQVLFNLAGNAIKFTDRGSIRINAERTGIKDDKPLITFSVEDTGPGIPPEEVSAIFGEFVQGQAGGQKPAGTGLGLSISNRLAEMMGGQISVDSEPGRGSLFSVSLPLRVSSEEEYWAMRLERESEVTAMKGSFRILVVDDNQSNQIVTQGILERILPESSVIVAANGFSALEILASEAFDLVLMDVRMSGMDGYETTRKLRLLPNENAGVPVVALTASVIRSDIEQCRKAGMDGYIPKPVSRQILARTLREFLKIGEKDFISTPKADATSFLESLEIKPSWAPLLFEMCNGKKERFLTYLQLFLVESGKELETWDRLAESRDHEHLARSLHKIMPHIKIFTGETRGRHAMEVEGSLRLSWNESFRRDLETIRQSLTEVMEEAKAMCQVSGVRF